SRQDFDAPSIFFQTNLVTDIIGSCALTDFLLRTARRRLSRVTKKSAMASSIKIPAADSNAATSTLHHASPPLGLVAIIFTLLFGAGLCFVVSFGTGGRTFPAPWESADAIVAYFQTHSRAVLMCTFFHFGAAIALGEFAVS